MLSHTRIDGVQPTLCSKRTTVQLYNQEGSRRLEKRRGQGSPGGTGQRRKAPSSTSSMP